MRQVVKEVTIFETGDIVEIKNLELHRTDDGSSRAKRFKESGKKAMVLYYRDTKEGITYGVLLDNAKFITFKDTDKVEYIGHIDMSLLFENHK